MYGKIFESMLEGTLYGEWEAICTFSMMIMLADSGGVVDMTPKVLSVKTSIPLDIVEKGLSVLEKPDPYSRTDASEGRRIELIDAHRPWGWHIVNHEKYAKMVKRDDKLKADRERIASTRQKESLAKSMMSQNVASVADVAHEVEVEVEDVKEKEKEKEKGRQQVATISPLAKSADADDYREFASRMWISIQSLTNQQKAPNLETWADEIRKLIEIDRQPLPVAWEVFNWANKDKFWQGNILSAANFRKHFPKLYAQSRGDAPVDFSAIARNHKDIF